MAKISTYNLDSSLNDNDKLIGTDGGTGLTKNFSVRTFINYINQQGNVNIVSSVNGLVGDVVLNTDDIPEGTNKYDQEVTITGSGSATVTGLYPNFNVSSENDTYIAGDNITINNDNVISSSYQDTTYTAGNNISISQDNVISAIDTNTDTTYTAGNGLSLNGTEFINDFPDREVTITGSGDTTVTGKYPSFNISSDGGVKSIVAGDNITIDPISGTGHITISSTGTEYTAGVGLALIGTEFQNTAPDQEVTITGSGAAVVTGDYPSFNISVTSSGGGGYHGGDGGSVDSVNGQTGEVILDSDDISDVGKTNQWDKEVTITGSGATTVTGNYPSFTVSSPAVNTDNFITNANDTYSSVSKVTDIITLTQAEYDGLTPDENAIYIIVG